MSIEVDASSRRHRTAPLSQPQTPGSIATTTTTPEPATTQIKRC
jgi:hypothetical protein